MDLGATVRATGLGHGVDDFGPVRNLGADRGAAFDTALRRMRPEGGASRADEPVHGAHKGAQAPQAMLDDVLGDLAGRAAADPAGLAAVFRTAFGDRAAGNAGAALLDGLAATRTSGADAALGVEIRTVGEAVLPPGAKGAYLPAEAGAGRGTILVHRDLMADPGTLRMVVAEELGHHLDTLLGAGAGDARGDEGRIFAGALAGEALGPGILSELRMERDHGRLLTGERVEFYEPEGASSGASRSSSSSQSPSSSSFSSSSHSSSSGPGPGEGSMDAAASHSQSNRSSSASSSPGPGERSMDAAASHSRLSSGSDDNGSSSARAPDTFRSRSDRSSDDDDNDHGPRSSHGRQVGPAGSAASASGDDARTGESPSASQAVASFGWEGSMPSAMGSLLDEWAGTAPGPGPMAIDAEAEAAQQAGRVAQAAVERLELERFERAPRNTEVGRRIDAAPAAETRQAPAATPYEPTQWNGTDPLPDWYEPTVTGMTHMDRRAHDYPFSTVAQNNAPELFGTAGQPPERRPPSGLTFDLRAISDAPGDVATGLGKSVANAGLGLAELAATVANTADVLGHSGLAAAADAVGLDAMAANHRTRADHYAGVRADRDWTLDYDNDAQETGALIGIVGAAAGLTGLTRTASRGLARGLDDIAEEVGPRPLPDMPEPPRMEPGISDHIRNRDHGVRRTNGIGGAHNADVFDQALQDTGARVVSRIADPDIPGVEHVRYQMPALDSAGRPTGGFRNRTHDKTTYDPAIIPDEQMMGWGRDAAQQAQQANAGRLPREWTGTTARGVHIHGYTNDAGVVRSFHLQGLNR